MCQCSVHHYEHEGQLVCRCFTSRCHESAGRTQETKVVADVLHRTPYESKDAPPSPRLPSPGRSHPRGGAERNPLTSIFWGRNSLDSPAGTVQDLLRTSGQTTTNCTVCVCPVPGGVPVRLGKLVLLVLSRASPGEGCFGECNIGTMRSSHDTLPRQTRRVSVLGDDPRVFLGCESC